MNNRKIPVGIGIPADMLERIDKERGDLPRSVYVTKLLKQALEAKATPATKGLKKESTGKLGSRFMP